MAPLVILVTAMLAMIFGHSTAETELLSQVEGLDDRSVESQPIKTFS
jgi:hypothetical protein